MGTKCTQKLADSNLKHSPLSLSLSQKFRINERGEKKQTKGRGKKHKKFVINIKEICKNQVRGKF